MPRSTGRCSHRARGWSRRHRREEPRRRGCESSLRRRELRSMKALPPEFYDRPVLEVARDLIGCTVEHRLADGPTARGVIVETEAYHQSEPACHAFVGLTPRTQTLFGEPGRA